MKKGTKFKVLQHSLNDFESSQYIGEEVEFVEKWGSSLYICKTKDNNELPFAIEELEEIVE